MPVFLVEDGTGVVGATSYAEVAYVDDYLGASWAADNAAKEAALVSGSEYADARWGAAVGGYPLTRTQGLVFPRAALYDRYGCAIAGIPANWLKAVCLYAKASAANSLYPVQSPVSAKEIKKKKTVVGPITTEVEYQGIVRQDAWLKFPLADSLVSPYLRSSGGGVIRN